MPNSGAGRPVGFCPSSPESDLVGRILATLAGFWQAAEILLEMPNYGLFAEI
jgi:hypothetical protein